MTAAQPGFTAPSVRLGKTSNGYLEAGGNFFNAADAYWVGQSVRLVGDFIVANRNDFVVALRHNLLESRWQLARDLIES